MATAAANQLYPLSSADGVAIPLDIILPLGASFYTVAADAHTVCTIPAGYTTVSIYCDIDVLLDFTNTEAFPVAGDYTSALLVHKETIISALLPSTGNVRAIPLVATESGILRIQQVQKWAGLGLAQQLVRR